MRPKDLISIKVNQCSTFVYGYRGAVWVGKNAYHEAIDSILFRYAELALMLTKTTYQHRLSDPKANRAAVLGSARARK